MAGKGISFRAAPEYQPLLRAEGLDAEAVFAHPKINVWRKLADRENCTLDAAWPDGRVTRLHIKRYEPARGTSTPADDEATGLRALQIEKIPTAPLVGWGRVEDGRSFVILEDLAGFRAADRLIEGGVSFERLLGPTAELAGKLHDSGLHHRDLYLCHFFAKIEGEAVDVRLIDAARVRRLPGWPLRNRWIVKDLAQFWYSALRLGISDALRMRWLERYAEQRGIVAGSWRKSIERKVRWIEKHDRRLNASQPNRNVSIPEL